MRPILVFGINLSVWRGPAGSPPDTLVGFLAPDNLKDIRKAKQRIVFIWPAAQWSHFRGI